MKKVLSFVLVLALILGSVSMAFAAPAAAPTKSAQPFEDAKTSYVATVLRDMGVLTGAGGEALLDETITRAEFCAMILRSLGLEDVAKAKQETKFSDVPKEKWYSGYVATANNQGLVGGYPDGTFLPEETVTANEAIAFVVKALGYSAEHLDGVWPTNFQLKAKDLGIIPAGYDYSVDGAKRGVVFEVLLNGLDCQLVKWNAKQDEYKTQNTTMGTRLGLPSGFTGVLSGAFPLYKIATITVSAGETFGNGFDASEFAGQTLNVLQKDNGAANNSPAAVYTNIGLSEATTKPLAGKFSSDAPFGATATTFTAVDKTVYTVVVGAANAAKYYRNGEELTSAAAVGDCTSKVSVEINAQFNPDKATEITTISSIAYSIKTGTTMVTASEAAFLAEGKFASLAALATPLKDVTSSAVVEGDATKLADIKEKDVVDYYSNLAGKITRLVVTRNVVKGAVTSINVTTKTYTMNGTGYVDGGYGMTVTPNAAGLKAASEYAFYLDSANKIFDSRWADESVPPVVTINYKYAFVLESTSRAVSRLVGEEIVTTTNSSLRLLPVGETTELTFEYVTPKMTSSTGVLNATTYAWDAEIAPEKLAKYALNDSGELIYLEKESVFFAADNFALSGAITKLSASGFNGKLYASDMVVVLFQTSASITSTMAGAYSVKTVADVAGVNYAGSIYQLNKAGKIGTFILKSAVVPAGPTVTVAAVAIISEGVDAGGNYYNILKDGVADKKYTSMASTAFTANQIVQLELTGDKVTSLQAVALAGVTKSFTTTKGISVSSGVVKVAAPNPAAPDEFSLLNPVVYAYKSGAFTVATDISAALSAGKAVNFYDLNGDNFYELVVIDGAVK